MARDTQLKIIIDAQDRTKGALGSVNRQLGETSTVAGRLGSALKTTAAVAASALGAAAFSIGTVGLQTAAQLETAEVGLTTLLGSTEKAAKAIDRIKKEAVRTPFSIPGLSMATQLLSSVTKDGDRSIDIIMDIGEALAAMGKGQAELDRIIVNLQQIGAIGYASMVDIKQFAYAGIPIFEMLAEATGLAGAELETFIGEGQVTFEMLTKMFDKANDSGERFFNAYKNNAGTFNQSLASMKESFGIFAVDVMTQTGLFSGLNVAMQKASEFLLNYKSHIENFKTTISSLLQELDAKTGLITLFKDAWANVSYMWATQLKPALMEWWEALKPFKPFLDEFVKLLGGALVVAIGAAIHIMGMLAVILGQLLTWGLKLYTFYANSFIGVWNEVTDAIVYVSRAVDELIEKFEKAWSWANRVVNKVGGKIAGGINKVVGVDDAVISPSGQVISTHPDDWLIATKNPASLTGGGGITVNINGGTYLSEDAAERMGDLIMKRLGLSNAL